MNQHDKTKRFKPGVRQSKGAAGFIRKGKALVFTTGGNETLSQETVNDVLKAGREEHAHRIKSGIRRPHIDH